MAVQGHDSPLLTYAITAQQHRALVDWGANSANKQAYNTVADCEGKPENNLIQMVALRAMMKAKYSVHNIGTALLELLEGVEYQLLPTDIHEVDITKIDEVTQFVYVNRPDVIINCAGMTDVAECEKNIDEAYRVNAIGVRNVALAANDIDAKVIQISTDDVFDKESRIPYNEFDTVHPRTIYGKSKEAGEKILTQLLNRFVIIRSSWIYGIGRDFVDEVLRNAAKGGTMEVPNNQYAAPTSAFELARVICHFIDSEEYGLYHVVCPGSCSRYEFARTILEYTGKTGDLDLYPVVARDDVRPTYSVLDNMMLRLTGIPEPLDWKTALKEYLEETGGIE